MISEGAVQVRAVCESALAVLAEVVDAASVGGSREQWAAAVGAAQRVINLAGAVQNAAIARLAAIEPQSLDDGTVVECPRALGHVALDAPAIVSGVLSVSAGYAEQRVRAAVRLAGDGAAGSDSHSGLGGLHAAMLAGRLDAYRAGVLADELEHAPAPVRCTVVAAMEGFFGIEDGVHLRRRCRRVLARISPDLLHQRAARARAESGLRRWAEEPGVDRWEGTFPSEDAARAWAAIDALARRYRTDGMCSTIERARAKALTDLVAGHATITTVLTVTVPATALTDVDPTPTTHTHVLQPAPGGTVIGEGDLVQVTGPGAADPVLVSRRWLTDTMTTTTPQLAPCHPVTGALLDQLPAGTTKTGAEQAECADPVVEAVAAAAEADGYTPSTRTAKRVRARDRRCRFPGCAIAAVYCDLDHVRPWPAGPTRDDNLLTVCRRHHRVKQRPGWTLTLGPDGLATWTDPTARVRTTHPVNALTSIVLTGPAGTTTGPSSSRARRSVPDGPHTELEFHLEHHTATPPGHPPPRPTWRDDRGHTHRIDLLPTTTAITVHLDTWPGRRAQCHGDRDLPPF